MTRAILALTGTLFGGLFGASAPAHALSDSTLFPIRDSIVIDLGVGGYGSHQRFQDYKHNPTMEYDSLAFELFPVPKSVFYCVDSLVTFDGRRAVLLAPNARLSLVFSDVGPILDTLVYEYTLASTDPNVGGLTCRFVLKDIFYTPSGIPTSDVDVSFKLLASQFVSWYADGEDSVVSTLSRVTSILFIPRGLWDESAELRQERRPGIRIVQSGRELRFTRDDALNDQTIAIYTPLGVLAESIRLPAGSFEATVFGIRPGAYLARSGDQVQKIFIR